MTKGVKMGDKRDPASMVRRETADTRCKQGWTKSYDPKTQPNGPTNRDESNKG